METLHVEFEDTPACWCAYYDPEGEIARGNTREAAVTELLEHYYEAWGIALDERNTARKELAETQRRLSDTIKSLRATNIGGMDRLPDDKVADRVAEELDWWRNRACWLSDTKRDTAEALKRLYEETADYITINKLGDVHHNRSMQMARDALVHLSRNRSTELTGEQVLGDGAGADSCGITGSRGGGTNQATAQTNPRPRDISKNPNPSGHTTSEASGATGCRAINSEASGPVGLGPRDDFLGHVAAAFPGVGNSGSSQEEI